MQNAAAGNGLRINCLMLMPHAWPAPFKAGGVIQQEDIAVTYQKCRDLARLYSNALGIPAMFVNQAGPIPTARWAGIITGMMGNGLFHLPGLSNIVDSDGTVLAQLGHEPGVAVAEVRLDPACKHFTEPPHYGEFLHPGAPVGRFLIKVDEISGKISYAMSAERKRRGREISGG